MTTKSTIHIARETVTIEWTGSVWQHGPTQTADKRECFEKAVYRELCQPSGDDEEYAADLVESFWLTVTDE